MVSVNYKILFYFTTSFDPQKGGVERVSMTLGKWLINVGCTVYYLSEKRSTNLDLPYNIYLINENGLEDPINQIFFKKFILDNSIDFVINQAGIFSSSLPLVKLIGNAKLITVMHNTLFGMYSHPNLKIHNKLFFKICNSLLCRNIFIVIFYLKYHSYYKKMVQSSDRIVLLSERFISEIKYYSGQLCNNIYSIPNPLSLEINKEDCQKKKEVLFVGRLEWQKRPDLLLDIWSHVIKTHKDWNLIILGDGTCRKRMEAKIQEECIENVCIKGFQDPIPYYKRASILCMTSCYESFGLVLLEAMNYNVIPIAFNSYPNLRDIIDDKKDGYIVKPFDIREYVAKLNLLMSDERQLQRMQNRTKEKVEKYTIDAIQKLEGKILLA